MEKRSTKEEEYERRRIQQVAPSTHAQRREAQDQDIAHYATAGQYEPNVEWRVRSRGV
jgi:hypothetical protein